MKYPLLEAAMNVSHSNYKNHDLQKISNAEDIIFSADFWDEFIFDQGQTDNVQENHKLLQKLTQFQHHAEHKRTSKLVQSYKAYNPMITMGDNNQGLNRYTTLAFSEASMIRSSCRVFIESLNMKKLIISEVYKRCLCHINNSIFHSQTRNMILMILIPTKLHVDDYSHSAFLRSSVSRLANETVIDREGIFYLKQVTDLVEIELGLIDFTKHVNVSYKTYYNSHHPDFKTGSGPLITEAVDQKFCPVAAVDTSLIPEISKTDEIHTMVLDKISDGNFVFKNTYAKNKQVKIPLDEGPLEFYNVIMEPTKAAMDQLKKSFIKTVKRTKQKFLTIN